MCRDYIDLGILLEDEYAGRLQNTQRPVRKCGRHTGRYQAGDGRCDEPGECNASKQPPMDTAETARLRNACTGVRRVCGHVTTCHLPTHITAPTIQCVVLTGMASLDAANTVNAVPNVMTNPLNDTAGTLSTLPPSGVDRRDVAADCLNHLMAH